MRTTAIGAYQIVDVIARGGAGVVYRATDPRARRDVAIKVLLAGRTASKAQLERFERESVALARLQHPNVVGIHTFGQHLGSPYLVMDLVEGESLWDRLRRQGPIPSAEAAEIGLGLALALQHAHEQGILHRDVKPHNVLLEPSGLPRLTDFGLALVVDSSQGALTKTGVLMGTPGFLPPEQAFNLEAVGPPADVYGLGATLYAVLTGVPPHSADDMSSFLAALATEEPTPPHELCAIDPALEAIVLKCLRKSPEQRYLSAEALVEDLRSYNRGEGSAALREQQGQRKRRRTLRGAAIAAAGLGFLALFTWAQPRPVEVATAPAATSTTVGESNGEAAPEDEEEWEDEEGWDDDRAAEQPSPRPSGYDSIKDEVEAAVAGGGSLLDVVGQVAQSTDAVGLYQARKERKRAWKLFKTKLDAVGALRLFDTSLEKDPHSANGHAKRGFVLYAVGDVEEARQELDLAVEMDSTDDDTFHYRGLVRAEEGDFEGALEDLTHAVNLKSKDDDLWIQRARIRLALGDYEGALSDARKAAELGERGQWPHAVSARANLGLGNLEQALADCARAGGAAPWGMAARAAIRREQGDLSGACQDLAAALKLLRPNLRPKHIDSRRFESRLFQRQMFRELVADIEATRGQLAPDHAGRAELGALLERCRRLEQTHPVFLPLSRE